MEDKFDEIVFTDGTFTLIKTTYIEGANNYYSFRVEQTDIVDEYKLSIEISQQYVKRYEYSVYMNFKGYTNYHFSPYIKTGEYIDILRRALTFALRVEKYLLECGFIVLK